MKNDYLKKNPLYIADIGASGGINSRWQKKFFKTKGVLFEPDPKSFHELNQDKDNKFIYFNSALSDSSKRTILNICDWREASSIFEPNFNLLNKYPNPERFKIIDRIHLKTEKLDKLIYDSSINQLDFIKIDTQGSELEILKGAENTLKDVVGLEVEVEFVELYKNQPLFSEVNDYLLLKRFDLYDLKMTYWKKKGLSNDNKKGQLIYADALYFKPPKFILSMKNVSSEKIIRTMFIYLAYGYYSLAKEIIDLSFNKNFFSRRDYLDLKIFLKNNFKSKDVPNFKGKGRLKNLFFSLSKKFEVKGFSSGSDTSLGN